MRLGKNMAKKLYDGLLDFIEGGEVGGRSVER